MNVSDRGPVSFGPFRLSPATREFEKDGVPVPLGHRALDILIVLVEQAGEVVSHRDLISRVWRDLIVSPGNLRVHMTALRKALADGRDGARYITNVTGQGYCFVARIARQTSFDSPEQFPEFPDAAGGRLEVMEQKCPQRAVDSAAHNGSSVVGCDPGDASVGQLRAALLELFTAISSALDDERVSAEESLIRAAIILRPVTEAAAGQLTRGGLAPWQVRKVTAHIEANLGSPIRSDVLASIVRLNACHFSRAFRNTFGTPPLQYIARRRIEYAQGLMLSSDAPLSQIALECGCADQAHFSRLFRRFVGESPRDWRRARTGHVNADSDSNVQVSDFSEIRRNGTRR